MARVQKTIGGVVHEYRLEQNPAPTQVHLEGSAPRSYHHGDLHAALLAAAEEELVEVGLAKFSLRGTARRAHVSHAAPAHHFANAGALLSALAEDGFARLANQMEREMQLAGDAPPLRLATAGRAYIAFAQAHPQLFRLMFFKQGAQLQTMDSAETKAAGGASKRAFAILRGCVEALLGSSPPEAAIATGIAAGWGLVHGISQLLIEDAMGFLTPFSHTEQQAVIDGAIDRLIAGFTNVGPRCVL